MKIGTSLGKCVKDILDGTVREDEILFIVSGTMCPDLPRLLTVIEEYYWNSRDRPPAYDISDYSLDEAKSLAQRLFESGKLHQPRTFSNTVYLGHHLPDTWLDVVPTNNNNTPAVVEAYNHYQMLSALTK